MRPAAFGMPKSSDLYPCCKGKYAYILVLVLYCCISYIYFNKDSLYISLVHFSSFHVAPGVIEHVHAKPGASRRKMYENKFTEKGIHVATSIVPNIDSIEWQNDVTDPMYNKMPARLVSLSLVILIRNKQILT